MKFFNLKNRSEIVDLETAVTKSLASDGGLYFPTEFPNTEKGKWLIQEKNISYSDLVSEYSKIVLSQSLSPNELEYLTSNLYSFSPKVNEFGKNFNMLELFHGPTLSFKDFGAAYLAQLVSLLSRRKKKKTVVLVATSGDTGSAVAHGFYEKEGVKVVLLYPKDKVSHLQEKHLTAFGKNITALKVSGTFDDCQAMVKEAFVDMALRKDIHLIAANSINVGRLLPQSFYYLFAFSRLENKEGLRICVPSGNFGNISSAVIATKFSNLKVEQFVAATNVNKIVPDFLKNQKFNPQKSIETLSNAMDVGNPSNFPRLYELFGNNFETLKNEVSGKWYDDAQTQEGISSFKSCYNEIIDPHTAVGYMAIRDEIKKGKNVLLASTAHPAKFIDTIESTLKTEIPLPEALEKIKNLPSNFTEIEPRYKKLKEVLVG